MLLEVFLRFSAADCAAVNFVDASYDALGELVRAFASDLQQLSGDIGPLEDWAVCEVRKPAMRASEVG